ncbi:MAG: hypothetical protein N3A69_01810 [Leptospiraceae bacterium]|nr:hypothetical protein [Leptospiraceae bacterium]
MQKEYLLEKIQKGKEFFKLGHLEKAVYYLSQAQEIEETPEALFYLGLIASQKNQILEALSYFYRSYELDSNYGNPCNEIGVILLKLGKEKEAIYWLKRSIHCKVNDALHIALFNLATLYKIWNRPERSLQYLHKAIEFAPDFEEAKQLRDEILSSIL